MYVNVCTLISVHVQYPWYLHIYIICTHIYSCPIRIKSIIYLVIQNNLTTRARTLTPHQAQFWNLLKKYSTGKMDG